MSPRNDDTPRRGQEPRRGASSRQDEPEPPQRSRGGIGAARAYTPRGRTVRETDQRTRNPRAGRNTGDPFRPSLQVLDGGSPARERRRDEEPARGRGVRIRDEKNDRGERAEKREQKTRATAGAARARSTANPRRTAGATRDRKQGRIEDRRRSYDDDWDEPRVRRTEHPRTEKRRPPVPPEPPKLANSTRRLRLGTVLALAFFVMIGMRLVVLQVSDSPAQARAVLAQREQRIVEVEIPAARGSILDRDGGVLAHSVEARYVYADPEMVEDVQRTAATLSPLLGVPVSDLAKKMAKQKRADGTVSRFEYLARGVDIAVAERIDALDLAGIGSRRDERRDVPGADLAANLIGFIGADASGLEGLEARYEELLRGNNGKKKYEVGRADLAKEIPGGFHEETAAQPGSSLQLTIDSDLQYEVQRYLTQFMKEQNATVAGAIVLDAKTGEVLAQASYPTYNAQKPFDYDPKDRIDAVSSVITDPGSTHKAFTIGAALQEGLIDENTTVTVGRGQYIGGEPFSDTHKFPDGTKLTIPQVLAYSSNLGTIAVGRMLGKEKLYEYQQKFGLGRSTNEGMAGEASGNLLEPQDWSDSAWGAVPIGHSVDATMVQMAAGYAAIANDGTYIQPHLIKATISGTDGTVTPAAAPETHEVLSPDVAKRLRLMLEAPVDAEGATARKAKVEGFRVAGKTGTGKLLVDGQYTSDNAGSFIGMAPAEDPRFVIGVFADVPSGTGGDVAAPAFSKMMETALSQYHVPPSDSPAPKFDWKD